MGKIAASYCDKIYLTDDNPRKENPKKIREDIKKGILKKKYEEISNRKLAIGLAIEQLKTGQILVVAGKGQDILLIDNQFENSSSRVAAGLLNPIVPKGVRKTWQCDILFPALFSYYRRWEQRLNTHFIDSYPFLNIHANEGESLEWEKRVLDPEMEDWLRRGDESAYAFLTQEPAT